MSGKPKPEAEDALFDDELDNLEEEYYAVDDPLESYNRAIFYFNDKLYFWALKPIAQGYRAVVPWEIRTVMLNFFNNLATPVRLVNNLLQGKWKGLGDEFGKFFINTTVGLLGLANPAEQLDLNPDPEDLGQSLGNYGIGDGFYIVWPFLGSSTLRDTIGDVGDRFLSPTSYVTPMEASLSLSGYNIVNKLSFRLGDYESLKKAALDPYESMRNAYIQLRQAKLKR